MIFVSYCLYNAGKSSNQPILQYHLSNGDLALTKDLEEVETEVTSSGSDEALLSSSNITRSNSSITGRTYSDEDKNLEFSPLHITKS